MNSSVIQLRAGGWPLYLALIPAMLLLLLLSACVDSSELTTPREYVSDDNIVVAAANTSISVFQDGAGRAAEKVENRFRCIVNTAGPKPLLTLNIELQVKDLLPGALSLNSVYFRSNAQPVDGVAYSLSGDPENPANEEAAKVLFRLPNGALHDYVPAARNGSEDNFTLRVLPSDNTNTLNGSFSLQARLPAALYPPELVAVSGIITISLR